MEISTCSGAISLAKQLENDSAKVYQELAQKLEKEKDLFLGFAKDNGKYYTQIERAYYGVITDAIEGCFAFNLNPDHYQFKKTLPENIGPKEAIAEALKMEESMLEFCQTAAEQSKHLMADVPRAFSLVAKKRSERISKLKELLEKTK
ncbi:MAG: hypothetical protein HXY44_00140 [Syntrophaceae bacterium]|nr:hypothetical protein [Syntrophaceae bacterium]